MWRVRMGDWPTRIPATNAPSTVWTPMASVIRAIPPAMARTTVITGSSLTDRSLAHLIRKNTIGRPMVKLSTRKRPVPATLRVTLMASIPPCSTRPKVTDMMIQPTVSSMMAEATMTWPTVRRRKPSSRTTRATIFTEEMESAVPRNKEVMKRLPGSGSTESGSQ